MALGTPVIATNLGEQREIVRSGVNGYLVDAGNPTKLAETIIGALNDPMKLGQLSLEARLTAKQYSIDSYVRTLEQWYSTFALAGQRRLKAKEIH